MSNTIKGTVATKGNLNGNLYGVYGKDGLSAYEIAVKNGFKGTEKEWVDSLGIQVTADGTVVSQNADFAEVAEWGDGNPLGEDRTGYFVCADVPVHGIVMKKATSTDDVKGVTISAPAFAGNYSKDKVDANGNLLPKYSYVAIIGFVPVRDNGTCEVGGRCMPDDNGCAIPSSNSMGYQVVNRIAPDKVLIIIEPNGDMVQRIKTKVNDIQSNTANTIKGTATGSAISMRDVSPIEHNVDVKLSSKNVFDGKINQYLALSGSGDNRTVTETTNRNSAIIKVKPNTTYWFSGDFNSTSGRPTQDNTVRVATFTKYPKVGDISNQFAYNNQTFSIKTSATTNYLLLWFIIPPSNYQVGEFQVEEGSSATPYTPYISDAESRNILNPYDYVDTSIGGVVYINPDGSVYLYSQSGKDFYTEITYTFDVTEKSVLSFLSNASDILLFVDEVNAEEPKVLDIGTHTFRIHLKDESSATVYIQLEKGTTPTPYKPYISDLSSVEVKRYGKNLLNDAKRTEPISGNVYFGTETTNGSFTLHAGTYTFSVDMDSSITPNVYVNKKDGTNIVVNYGKNYVSFTLTEQTDIVAKVYNGKITSAEQVYTAQIERGAIKTTYEPYIAPTTYHFNADGTPAEPIKSISPNMTLISNNEGAVINCNYNVDTKTYIDNKFAELQALILEG